MYKLILTAIMLLLLISCATPEPVRYETDSSPVLGTAEAPGTPEPPLTPTREVPNTSSSENLERESLPEAKLSRR